MKKAVCILTVVLIFISGVITAGKSSYQTMTEVTSPPVFQFGKTIILDAGHGGEDGGAVAPDGTMEKDLNLVIANTIASYFELFGIPYIPVRTTDESVCDPGLTTVRERKRSDILNRYALINDTPNSVLLSIHQNMFSEPKYNGTQVFYAGGDANSEQLASLIRDSVLTALQPDNTRAIKPSTDSIYLLYHAKTTSVLVECGFLSNENELQKLKDEAYESQISYYIFKAMLQYLSQ